MARKNMWSATAAVGDAELRGVPEGYAPEIDGTIELPRAMPGPSANVYTVGRLGGAHRRSEKPGRKPSSSAGRSSVPRAGGSRRAGRNDRTEQTGEWTSIWPDEQPTVPRPSPVPHSPQTTPPADERGTTTGGYDRGPSGYDRGPSGYDRGPAGYDVEPVSGRSGARPAPAGHPAPSGRPVSGSRPTSGSRTGGGRAADGGSRRRPKAGSRRSPSRPMRYTGSRRKFSSWAPLAGGVLMLVLVLGATMLAEADRYTGSTSSAGSAPASVPAAGAQQSKAPPSARKAPATAPAAEAVAAAINKQLDNLGCGRVEVDPTLVAIAGDHVDDMLAKGYFDTAAPDGGGTLDRAKSAGYPGKKVVESVVSGAGNPAEAAQAAFPAPDATSTVPATVKAVSGGNLTCGWTAVGAEARMNSKSVAYWSIVLGQ